MKKYVSRALLGSLVLASAGAANAAIDTTAAVASITDVNTAVLAIGVAVFGIAVSVKLYKWLRSGL